MSQPSEPQNERRRLEQELLRRLRAAEVEYREALAACQEVRAEFGQMSEHPDGTVALERARIRQRHAFEQYAKALRDFTDLTVYGRPPAPPPEEPDPD